MPLVFVYSITEDPNISTQVAEPFGRTEKKALAVRIVARADMGKRKKKCGMDLGSLK